MRPVDALRRLGLAGVLLGLAACAHRPTAPSASARTLIPSLPAATAPAHVPVPQVASSSMTVRPPDDYTNLWDRMRAGFALLEVQEPAIDQQV
ncbi:MAG TPA: hypothetical protein VMU86_01535, partial [Steroidobacteraceae bacterium]|nr:hypothetical protein [Steroidobacteraceae bacterium]